MTRSANASGVRLSSTEEIKQAKRRERALKRKIEKAETQARKGAKQAKMLAACRLSFSNDESSTQSNQEAK